MPEARFAWNGNGPEHTLQELTVHVGSKSHVITHVLRARTTFRWYCARLSTNPHRRTLEAALPLEGGRLQNSDGAR